MLSGEYEYTKSAQGWNNSTAVLWHDACKLESAWKFVLCLWEVCVQLLLPQPFSIVNANM